MANRIKAGSLVCMGRRVVRGQGIVLERIYNINEYVEFDLVDAWLKMYDRAHPDYLFSREDSYGVLWSLRTDATNAVKEEIKKRKANIDSELLKQFFSWNTAYSYQKGGNKITKLKTDFSLVKWYKAPSDYGDAPSHWHKDRQIWHPTKLLRNL